MIPGKLQCPAYKPDIDMSKKSEKAAETPFMPESMEICLVHYRCIYRLAGEQPGVRKKISEAYMGASAHEIMFNLRKMVY